MYTEKLFFLVLLVHFFDLYAALSLSDYLKIRTDEINSERQSYFGANLKLEGDEITANECLMKAKFDEIDEGHKNTWKFLPSRNFLNVREEIEGSEVFKIIKLMPKGASLHIHSTAAVSLDFIHNNLMFMPNLYMCVKGSKFHFRFFKTPGSNCAWRLLKDMRTRDPKIDLKLRKHLDMPTEKTTFEYNSALIWQKFEGMFAAYKGLILYRPAFERYVYQALQEAFDDGLLYMELRFSAYHLYDLDGTTYSRLEVVSSFKKVFNKFVKDHHDFVGAKLIFSPSKSSIQKNFDQEVKIFREIKDAFPDLVIGFDLVGEEDKASPIVNAAGQLLKLSNETEFYFHAGESNWFGHNADENLFDAVLMNSKRIGHGLALSKHPKLMEMVKKKNIAVEVCPISNQVLGYVNDMRNHPASHYFAYNLNVVVANDDPGFWGASGLSYDFYEAFMGIMPRHADLRTLKQLAINSILYSGLNSEEQQRAMDIWKRSWSKFVKSITCEHGCNYNVRYNKSVR